MAVLYISEFKKLGATADGNSIPIAGRATRSHTRALTTSSAQSNIFGGGTKFIRLVSDVDCFYELGTNPTALTTSALLPAGVIEYRAVDDIADMRIAARSVS